MPIHNLGWRYTHTPLRCIRFPNGYISRMLVTGRILELREVCAGVINLSAFSINRVLKAETE